jgi:transcription initiation factor TFIIH subunit 3
MLYASSDPQNQSQPIDSNAYQPFKLLDSTVVSRISHELDHLSQEDSEGSHGLNSIIPACSSVHSPLRARRCLDKSLVLCDSSFFSFIYIVPFLTLHSDINRISIGSSTTTLNHVDPRILILSVSPDLSTSYIPIMNSIFSAQKLVRLPMFTIARSLKLPQKVTIDACQVFGPDTVFLQQAAHLTGGAYLYLERRDALLQYLIVSLSIPNCTLNPHLYFFQDDVSPSLIDTQGPGDSHAR